MKCLSELDLARSLDQRDAALDAHLANCASCRDEHARFASAIALARELPCELPPPPRRADIRAAVLAAGSFHRLDVHRPRPRRRYLVAAGALGAFAAAAVALLVVDRDTMQTPSSHSHAHVVAQPGARFTTISTMPDEVIRLDDGTIAIDVDPLHRGERFLVRVGASEIEVRGTAFEVTAHASELISVVVTHGRVEVRPARGEHTLLGVGQAWRAQLPSTQPAMIVDEVEPVPEAPKPRPRVRTNEATNEATTKPTTEPATESAAPARLPAEAPSGSAPSTRAPEEVAYDEAWAAMRANNFSRAATAFSRVLIFAPDGALAEDAAFWQAVALARGQRTNQAVTAFRDFLDAHPTAARAGEASAMLGWLLVEAGDRVEAARRFRAAEHDKHEPVRKSAKSGLDALAR